MKILVTGGNGFIAKNLIESFASRYNMTSVTRKDFDLLNSGEVHCFIKKNHFDIIIHTATYDAAPKCSTKDSSKVLENNLRMFFNIARCQDYFEKMIYFGSGAEFGREHWTPKMCEDYFDRHVPSDQYGYSKYLMNKYALKSNNIYNLRLFGVFGKYDDWRYRFIPNICVSAVFDKPIKIKQNASFDYLYIDDLVKITEWFINNTPRNHVYNVCSGQVNDRITIARKLIGIVGKSLELAVENKDIKTEYSGDNSLLLIELNKVCFTTLEESIIKLYKWYNDNKDILDENLLTKYL